MATPQKGFCAVCGTDTGDRRRDRDEGTATVRRLFALRQRATAALPLFERNERAKTD
jgi:hypothetical protein